MPYLVKLLCDALTMKRVKIRVINFIFLENNTNREKDKCGPRKGRGGMGSVSQEKVTLLTVHTRCEPSALAR